MRRKRAWARARAPLALGVGAAACVHGVSAHASERSVTWSAPPECADEASFKRHLNTDLNPRLNDAADDQTVRVTVVRGAGGGWEVDVSVGGNGAFQKHFQARSCEDAMRGASVIVAVALGATPAATTPAPPDDAPLPPPSSPAPAAPRSSRGRDWRHWSVAAQIVGDAGTLPNAAIGPAVVLGWRFAPWRIELAGSFFAGQRATSASLPDASADLFVMSMSARGCLFETFGAAEIRGCAGPSIERTTAEGRGTSSPSSASSIDPGMLVGPTLAVPLGEVVALRADAELAYAFTRPREVVEGGAQTAPIFAPALVRVRGLAGVEARF